MNGGEWRAVARVVTPYVLVAGAWILFSDSVLQWFTTDPALANALQSAKGLLFVLVTAALLAVLLRRELRQRQAAHAARDDSQRFAARLAEAIPGLLYVFDLAEHKHVFVNGGLTSVLGYAAARFPAEGESFIRTLIHPDDQEVYFAAAGAGPDLWRAGEVPVKAYRMRHADGEWRWLESREYLLERDAAGQPRQVLSLALDITRQKQAEAAAAESARRYRTLADASPVGLFQTDAAGAYVYVNERWCAITGLTPEQARGTGWLAAIHPEDREQLRARWGAAVAAGQPLAAEYRIRRPDGADVWVAGRAQVEPGVAGAAGLVGTLMDITALKDAEARVQRLNRVYAVLSEINQTIVRVRERQPLLEAACRIAVTQGGFRLAWIGLADATGRQALAASAGAAGLRQSLETALAAEPRGPAFSAEALRAGQHALRPDSSGGTDQPAWLAAGGQSLAAFPLVVAGQVRGTFNLLAEEPGFFDAAEVELFDKLAMDLSFALEFIDGEAQRRQTQAALQQSEARFRAFFEHAPVYSYILAPDGHVLDVNQAVVDGLGYPRSALIGTPLRRLYAHAAAAPAEAADNTELRLLNQAGAERVVLHSAAAVRDEAGQLLYTIALQRDITDRVQAEAALRESETRYRLLAENISDVVWTLDVATQRFTYVSPSVERLRGYRAGEVLAQPLDQVVTPLSLALIQAGLPGRVQAFLAGDPAAVSQIDEVEQWRRDGSTVWTEVATTLLQGLAGELVVLGVSRDISRRRQAEAALRASEERYRRLAQNLPNTTVIVYDRALRITFIAGAELGVYGMTAEMFLGKTVDEIIPPETLAVAQPQLQAALAGQFNTYELPYPGGATYLIATAPLYAPDGSIGEVLVVSQNITGVKRAEAALRESETRLRTIFNEAPVSLWEADFSAVKARLDELQAAGHPDVRQFLEQHPDEVTDLVRRVKVLDVNATTVTLYRAQTKADLLGELLPFRDQSLSQHIASLLAIAAGQREFEQAVVDATLTGEPLQLLLRWVVSPGQEATYGRVLLSLMDITELKRVEAALRASVARYRGLFEHAPDAIFINRDNRVVLVNQACQRLFAAAGPEQLLGRSPLELFHPDDHAAIRERIRQIQEQDQPAPQRRERIVRMDGGVVDVEVTAAPFPDLGGSAIHVILRDITERQRQADAIQAQLTMLNALYARARELTASLEAATVAASVTRQCVETFGVQLAWLGEAETDGRVERLAHWPPDIDYPRQIRVRWDDSSEGRGPTGRAIRERRPIILGDLDQAAFADWHRATQPYRYRAGAAFPLVSGDRAIGALNLYSETPDYFSAERVALFQAFANQAAAALTNARLYQDVAEQRELLRGLAARLAEVEEAERRLLARELHDRVGANLTALNLNLTLVRSRLAPDALTQVGQRLDAAAEVLQETMAQVRDVMMELRPSVLDDYGLLAALRWYAEQLSQRAGLQVHIGGVEPQPRLPAAVETALFRVAQEALTNVVKHARAAAAEVLLETDGSLVRLSVVDSGVGFDPTLVGPRPGAGGWGMMNMRERAEALGGRLRLEAAPGRGARISVELQR